MSEDGGGCFGFKKKTVVMSCIALCCLSLVAWTILVTAHTTVVPLNSGGNSSALNSTLNSTLCTFNSSVKLEQVKMVLLKENSTSISRKNLIQKSDGATIPLCKCLCRLNITEELLLEAVKFLKLNSTAPIAGPNKKLTDKVGVKEDAQELGGGGEAGASSGGVNINIASDADIQTYSGN
ncbi:uncharacterized protein LOC111717886 [Eurytemora carolleeae]|uniref:uncharacterized protein LOC111717886 n=1 Tax=Eurytemora carolleeae TaxID=1294199 RepID=UPI000C76FA97|nr:uncharacterized protein LOC111717886 [Eurytemora carolleeae]|eukprot:XP_023349116.1 uncharacterized protein LOC111717886 [Eurytemora affinis]